MTLHSRVTGEEMSGTIGQRGTGKENLRCQEIMILSKRAFPSRNTRCRAAAASIGSGREPATRRCGWVRGSRYSRTVPPPTAIANFAEAYANQTEQDHAALCAAVKSGRVPTDEGV
jgi:hypothetical protein